MRTKSFEFILSVNATTNSGSKSSKQDSHDETKMQMPIMVHLSEDQVNQQQAENAKMQFSKNVYVDLKGVRYDLETHLRVIKISELTIVSPLSSKIQSLNRYNVWFRIYKLCESDGFT